VKPWLEGFDDGNGAGYVHEASAKIADMALDMAVENGDNIIIPRIGGPSVVKKLAVPRLIEKGYDVQLYFNDVLESTSIMRAASRFAEEGRYLSLDYLTEIDDKDYKLLLTLQRRKEVIMSKIKLTLDDLPTGLRQMFLLYWQTDEATDEQKALPHQEKVEAFLQWCRQEDNFNWSGQNSQKMANWLTEHGYSRIPNGSQTM